MGILIKLQNRLHMYKLYILTICVGVMGTNSNFWASNTSIEAEQLKRMVSNCMAIVNMVCSGYGKFCSLGSMKEECTKIANKANLAAQLDHPKNQWNKMNTIYNMF